MPRSAPTPSAPHHPDLGGRAAAELVIVGVDPGSRDTGIVARGAHGEVLAAELVRRSTKGAIPESGYVSEVCDALDAVVARMAGAGYFVVVAVEAVNAPVPHLGMSNPGGLLGGAMVLGGVIGRYRDAIVVRPGGHGSGPLDTYPDVLVGARETSGTGKRRHVRSAYDVAGAAGVNARAAQAAAHRSVGGEPFDNFDA